MKTVCNILIYMIFINVVTPFMFSLEAFSLIPIAVLAVIALLGYFLGNLEEGKQRLRFLSFLLLPLCFFPFESVSLALLLLPPCGYLVIKIGFKNFSFNFEKTRMQILLCLKIVFLPLFFVFFGGYEYLVEINYFLYLILFLVFSICLLRMLLNDENTVSHPRFILYNLGVIGGIFTALLALGSPFVMRLVFNVGALIVRFILVPLLLVFGTLVNFIFSLFTTYDDRVIVYLEWLEEEIRPLEGEGVEFGEGFFDGVPDPIWWIFILLAVVFLFIVLKGAMRGKRKMDWDRDVNMFKKQGVDVTREVIPRKDRRFFAPKDDRLAIRFYYGRFLKMCKEKGSSPKAGNTTKEICLENKEVFSESAMCELREMYIKARYSHDEIEQGEGKRSGELLKQL